MTWSKENSMSCNPKKCKELIFRDKGNNSQYNSLFDISQCSSLVVLRVTIQTDCKFRAHVNLRLIKANKCLHVLSTLRKEEYSQAEIDHLFTVLVSPNFIYGLPVYGASEPDLNIIWNFLDRCHKRRFIFYPVSIKDLFISIYFQVNLENGLDSPCFISTAIRKLTWLKYSPNLQGFIRARRMQLANIPSE